MLKGGVIPFVLAMTLIVGTILTALFIWLSPKFKVNEILANKKAVLTSVESYLPNKVKDLGNEDVEDIFSTKVEQYVVDYEGDPVDQDIIVNAGYPSGMAEEIDMAKEEKKDKEDKLFPVFVYQADNGDKVYVTSVRGAGLWDKIWGNVAIKDDFNTVAGVAFDHKGETPGLGAEIKDNPSFGAQFAGKQIFNEDGEYVSVNVQKGGAREAYANHEVDGITGATITANGVRDMMYEGIQDYLPYFDKVKAANK